MSEEIFFGRVQELANLQKRYQAFVEGYRQNIAFLGESRIGKTSLIKEFAQKAQAPSCILYYVNSSFNLYSELIRQFCFQVLNHFLRHEKVIQPGNEDIDAFIRDAEVLIPETIAKVKMMLSLSEGQQQRAAIAHVISLIDTFLKETNNKYKLLIVLDEFHQLKYTCGSEVYQSLAKFIISQKNVMFILLSSSVKEAEKILASDLHMIFGNFERMYLKELSLDEAKSSLDATLVSLPVDTLDKKFIVHVTGGHPFYLKEVGKELSRAIESGRFRGDNETPNYVFDAFKGLLFREQGSLHQLFQEQISHVWKLKHRNNLLKTMYLLADGYQRLHEMKIFIKNVQYIKSYLNKLVEMNIAVQSGHIFRIKDRLFLTWLNTVFRPARMYSDIESGVRQKLFVDKLSREYRVFKESISKENIARIIDLFSSFKGDTVYADNKKAIKLPHLDRVRLLRMIGEVRNRCFIIGEGNDILIAALKESALEESDVLDFKLQCTSLKSRKVKKCIVTLDTYTDNARLAAKENSINLWNKDDVNFLLRLYNKPVLI